MTERRGALRAFFGELTEAVSLHSIAVGTLLLFSGCSDDKHLPADDITARLETGGVADSPVVSELRRVNVGVVFSGEPTYHCLPLSQVGLVDLGSISSVEASCDCISPELVTYFSTDGDPEPALQLRIGSSNNAPAYGRASSLSVSLVIRLLDGQTVELLVDMLETSKVEHLAGPSTSEG